MDVILIPGLWLDASSWDDVLSALRGAGLTPHPLTMPGVGVPSPASDVIGIAEWVDAVVATIDRLEGPVVVVGHSGGGNVAWGAADARPHRIARVVLVDTAPPPPGAIISEFPLDTGVVPFPGWDFFDADEVSDLDAATRERTAPRTWSVPGRVPTDALALRDERRHRVPVTVLSGSLDDAAFRSVLSSWPAFEQEFRAVDDSEVVVLGTGHWPQFSQPERLGAAIVSAVLRAG
ncbi:alpha/beta fold hydrolase [Microbacterium dextranolyticum]|uniref:Esterase n=1 Tax=Microbacterium dextranolyticum TaxID=36806 RepID=A0A9W6HMH3_9MICO|nr:alpha/beta hydrolase [Microbacterium dextranolyticum]MBM7463126.1 pimeloyl-ACP methyl ester carboxylesterase [Microbacterium dextranolyticum]GLJ95768.1 esterase [Microbacterium dextranolyticum]